MELEIDIIGIEYYWNKGPKNVYETELHYNTKLGQVSLLRQDFALFGFMDFALHERQHQDQEETF